MLPDWGGHHHRVAYPLDLWIEERAGTQFFVGQLQVDLRLFALGCGLLMFLLCVVCFASEIEDEIPYYLGQASLELDGHKLIGWEAVLLFFMSDLKLKCLEYLLFGAWLGLHIPLVVLLLGGGVLFIRYYGDHLYLIIPFNCAYDWVLRHGSFKGNYLCWGGPTLLNHVCRCQVRLLLIVLTLIQCGTCVLTHLAGHFVRTVFLMIEILKPYKILTMYCSKVCTLRSIALSLFWHSSSLPLSRLF